MVYLMKGNMEEKSAVKHKINEILADQLGVPGIAIVESLEFGDIPQWDSLGHMSIIAALEEEFHLDIDADLIAELTSVRAIINYLEGRKNE